MLAHAVKPITYLKHATAALVRDVADHGQVVTITQHGEAKVVVMSAREYERWQQAVALLKLAGLAAAEANAGHVVSHRDLMTQLNAIVDAPSAAAGKVGDAA